MDAKITKLRLSRMLSYDWLKIVFATAAIIVAWLLIFTMTGTSIMPSQKFTVMNYIGNLSFSDEFATMNDSAFTDGVFSYEVIEQSTEDLAANESMAFDVLSARAAAEEGDVIFIADEYALQSTDETVETDEGTSYVYEKGENYLGSFVANNRGYLFDINEYLNDMRAFVGQYYTDYETGEGLNEQKIKDDFNVRTKKDKRFRKSSVRRQGEINEVERIKKYREALVKFEWYLNEKVVMIEPTVVENYFGEGEDFVGTYAINLCPSVDKGGKKDVYDSSKPAMHKLKTAVAYYPVIEDEKVGYKKDVDTRTAENMNVCLFDFKGVTDTFEYESLCYIVYVIDHYSSVPYKGSNA